MTIKEIQLKAAEILEASENSWCQGTYRRELLGGGHAYCIIGACREAAGYWAAYDAIHNAATKDTLSVTYHAANHAATQAIRGINSAFVAAMWNDAPGRTREEVIAALRGNTE